LSDEPHPIKGGLPFPVTITLYKNGHILCARVAESETDLYFSIEMDSGTGRLDTTELYWHIVANKRERAVKTIRVCHSYEKWGAMQQEVINVRVKLQRLAPSAATFETPAIEAISHKNETRIDTRGEWFREWDPMSSSINTLPRWYRVGMLLSVMWIVYYLMACLW